MKKLILILALLLPASLFSQVASDSFTYANGDLITLSGGNWAKSGPTSPFSVNSNRAANSVTVPAGLIWSGAGTFANDQSSQATLLISAASSRYAGPALRGTAGAVANYYYFVCSSLNCQAGVLVNGTTRIVIQGGVAHGLTAPFVMTASISGSTLTFKVNGSTPSGFAATYTNATITSGNPGIATESTAGTAVFLDDWSGDNISSAVTPTFTVAPVQIGATLTFATASTGCGSYIYWNTTGAPTTSDNHSTTTTMGAASATYYAKVIGCPTFADSPVGSQTYNITATPTTSPATGNYPYTQPVSLGCTTASPSIYYTTDGSTPTTGSTLYTVPFNSVTSGSETVKALCTTSGYGNSSVANSTLNILPASTDTVLVSDDFSGYYNLHLGLQSVVQNPIDTVWTQGKWAQVPPISGMLQDTTLSAAPALPTYFTAQRAADCTASVSGYCIGMNRPGSSTTAPAAMLVQTGATLGADQSESIYVTKGITVSASGPCTRTTAGASVNGYCALVYPNNTYSTVDFGKFVAGTWVSILHSPVWNSDTPGPNYTSPAKVVLRSLGSTHQVLINGSIVPGFESVSDSTFTSGKTGIYSNQTMVSNSVSSGVGNSTYAPVTYTPINPTYHITADASWVEGWPWIQAYLPIDATHNSWAVPWTGYSTGIGPIRAPYPDHDQGSELKFMGEFADEQWFQTTWTHDTAQPGNYWFASVLKSQTYAPGADDGQCASHGVGCTDTVGYYLETELNRGTTEGCPTLDKETCGTPFALVLKYTPISTPWNNEYDFPATSWSPRSGDGVYFGWYHSRLRAYCKNGATTAHWQASHAYALNDYYLDSNSHYQVVDTPGTSGSVEPTTYGTSWIYAAMQGTQTTSGAMVSEFFGAPCPAAPSNNGWALIFDAPETDLAGQGGQPMLGAHTGPSAYAFPLFTDIYMGSGHNALIDTVYGIEQPKSWVMN